MTNNLGPDIEVTFTYNKCGAAESFYSVELQTGSNLWLSYLIEKRHRCRVTLIRRKIGRIVIVSGHAGSGAEPAFVFGSAGTNHPTEASQLSGGVRHQSIFR